MLGARLNLPPDDVPLETDATGKPHVTDSGVCFNVSHAGGRGLIVVCTRPVGVDLEPVRRITDAGAIARRFFTSAEQTSIFRDDNPDGVSRRFLQCWTLKEALLKARGVGLSGSLTDFTVDFEGAPPGLTWHRATPGQSEPVWSLGFVPVWDDYIGAIAVESRSWQLVRKGRV